MWLCSQLALYIHYTAVQKKLYMLQYVKVQYFKCYFAPGVGKWWILLYSLLMKPTSVKQVMYVQCTLFSTVNPPSPYFWDSFKFPNEGIFYISLMYIIGCISVSRKTSFGFQGGTSDFGVLLPCVRINLHLTSCRRSQRGVMDKKNSCRWP